MLKRGKLLVVICAVALVAGLLIASCAQPAAPTTPTPPTTTEKPTTPEKVYNLTFATMHAPQNAMSTTILPGWFAWLEKESGGRIKVTQLPACQAADVSALYDAAKDGIVDMSCQMMNAIPGRWPLLEGTTLPGLYKYPASMSCTLTYMSMFEKYPELQAEHPDVKVLGFHGTEPHCIGTTKKPIRTLEDLSGMVIEMTGFWDLKGVAALGATPENLPWLDVYDALQKGILDGSSTVFEGNVLWNFYDVLKHGVITDLGIDMFIHVMNLNTWNSLPPDLQELFVGENAWRLATLYAYEFDKDDMIYRDWGNEQLVAKGGTPYYELPPDEEARWLAALAPIQEEWVKVAESKGAPGKAMLEDTKKFADQYSYEKYTPTVADWCEKQFQDWGYKWGAMVLK